MEKIYYNFLENVNYFWNLIKVLTTEQITLFSILVTVIIYLLSKRSEIQFKKLEVRRIEYKKFINLLQKVYTKDLKLDAKMKCDFFDVGVSLLIYGSKKIYKKYVFFRDYATNPLISDNKHNNKEIGIYIIADILKTIRHEVGLAPFGELESNEVLSFFVNDIGMNPLSKIQSAKAKYDIKMLKVELYMIDRYKFVHIKNIYYSIIKPIFGFAFLLFKYFFRLPLGRLIIYLFPTLKEKDIVK